MLKRKKVNGSVNLVKSYCIVWLISGFLVGCGNPDKKTDSKATGPFHPRIILKDQTAPEEFLKLISSFRVIPIEYSPDKIIGQIDKVVPDREDFLVLDYKSQSIKRISKAGKITGSFSHKGQAAGEYLILDDFVVHPVSHEIIVMDGLGRKIIFYDSSGSFQREFKLDFWGQNLAILSNDKIICFSDRRAGNYEPPFYHLNIVDLNGKILKRYLPYYSPWTFWIFLRSLVENNDGIFLCKYFDYNLYRINQQMDLDTVAVFDFGPYSMDTSGLARVTGKVKIAREKQSKGKLFLGMTFVFDDFCYLESFGGKGSYWGYGLYNQDFILHKRSEERYICFYNGWPVIEPMGEIGNELISWIEPVYLLDIWEKNPEEKEKAESHPEFKMIMDRMDIEGNPVLMLFSLKRE